MRGRALEGRGAGRARGGRWNSEEGRSRLTPSTIICLSLLQALSHLNPKILNKDGECPLHIAASMGDEQVLRAMLHRFCNSEKGFQVDMGRTDGETMLHICAKQGNNALVDLLVRFVHLSFSAMKQTE